jgi:hypothetical protein
MEEAKIGNRRVHKMLGFYRDGLASAEPSPTGLYYSCCTHALRSTLGVLPVAQLG